MREHIALTLKRTGRQAEHPEYFPSATRLDEAAAAFDEAEFDWFGSFPLGLDADHWDDGEDDEDEADDGDILTVIGRWDHRVVDEAALINAGRAAYARAWVDDTDEDASIAVRTPLRLPANSRTSTVGTRSARPKDWRRPQARKP